MTYSNISLKGTTTVPQRHLLHNVISKVRHKHLISKMWTYQGKQ